VLRRRAPHTRVIVAPAQVQGAGAAEQIARAIENLNKFKEKPDVILAGRGGGSMEDLWCFNEETAVRAIAASKIPVISCVGHETDFTLADFAADLRAPTPSAAAEIVSGDNRAAGSLVTQLARRLINAQTAVLDGARHRLEMALQTPFLKNPLALLNQKEQELDAATAAMETFFTAKQTAALHRLNVQRHKLAALSPKSVLKRGFSIVRKNGALVRAKADARAGDILNIETANGVITAKTE
jgi:exodeoxyribonuclease VII large subunit